MPASCDPLRMTEFFFSADQIDVASFPMCRAKDRGAAFKPYACDMFRGDWRCLDERWEGVATEEALQRLKPL